ncbi:MAG: B12-binding domain-containing radical SAM protein [Elusimicrobia bacterium]|nr:B12-binding domain-containing radical SAM protein [Elusimicrobiota bacterium]
MKISFVFPGWTQIFGPFSRVARGASIFPPLNLCYLAAVAERDGHEVQMIDGEVEKLTSGEIIGRINPFGPDIVGMTATTPMFHLAVKLASEIKKEIGVPVVIGGTHISLFGEKAFSDCFDFLFTGEAEESFAAFLKEYAGGRAFSSVPGLIFRQNGGIINTGRPGRIKDLDSVPFPARHLLKTDKYRVGTLRGKRKYTSIMISRGCPFECVYCSNRVMGSRVRRRSLAEVIREIDTVIEKHGVRHFYFIDDVLTLDRDYILDMCGMIKRKGIKMTYEGSTRADMVDEELMEKMADSGLIRLSFGLESTDPLVQKLIKKEIPLEKYVHANRLTKKNGIETINSVMLGLPGDTRESICRTIKFLAGSRDIQHATFSVAIPYPGTEFFEMAKKQEHGLRLVTEDFSKYQRYNSAVLSVNGMSPDDIMELQKTGLLRIYSSVWRIWPVLKRFSLLALIRPLSEAVFSHIGRLSGGKNTKKPS